MLGGIDQVQAERKNIEALLQTHEAALKRIEKEDLIAEARRLERNQAYPQAIHTWGTLRNLDPDDPQIDREIQRLQALQQRAQLLNLTLPMLNFSEHSCAFLACTRLCTQTPVFP
jgi:hypothetical protein